MEVTKCISMNCGRGGCDGGGVDDVNGMNLYDDDDLYDDVDDGEFLNDRTAPAADVMYGHSLNDFDLSTRLKLLRLQGRFSARGSIDVRSSARCVVKDNHSTTEDNNGLQPPTQQQQHSRKKSVLLRVAVNDSGQYSNLPMSVSFVEESSERLFHKMSEETLGKARYTGGSRKPPSFAFTNALRLSDVPLSPRLGNSRAVPSPPRKHYSNGGELPPLIDVGDMKRKQRALEVRPNVHSPRKAMPIVPLHDVQIQNTIRSVRQMNEVHTRQETGTSSFESRTPRSEEDFNMKALLKMRYDASAAFIAGAIPAPKPPPAAYPGPGSYDVPVRDVRDGTVGTPTFARIKYHSAETDRLDEWYKNEAQWRLGPGRYNIREASHAMSAHIPCTRIVPRRNERRNSIPGPGSYFIDGVVEKVDRATIGVGSSMFVSGTTRLVDENDVGQPRAACFRGMNRMRKYVDRVVDVDEGGVATKGGTPNTLNPKDGGAKTNKVVPPVQIMNPEEAALRRLRLREKELKRSKMVRQRALMNERERRQHQLRAQYSRNVSISHREKAKPQRLWIGVLSCINAAHNLKSSIRRAFLTNRMYILRVNAAARYIQVAYRAHRIRRRRIALRLILGKFLTRLLISRRIRKKRRSVMIIVKFMDQFPPSRIRQKQHAPLRLVAIMHKFHSRVIMIQRAWRRYAHILRSQQLVLLMMLDRFLKEKHKQVQTKLATGMAPTTNANGGVGDAQQQANKPQPYELLSDEVKMRQIQPVLRDMKLKFVHKKREYDAKLHKYLNSPGLRNQILQNMALYELCGKGNPNLAAEIEADFRAKNPPPQFNIFTQMPQRALRSIMMACYKEQSQVNMRQWRNTPGFDRVESSIEQKELQRQKFIERRVRRQQKRSGERIIEKIKKLFTSSTVPLERLCRESLKEALIEAVPLVDTEFFNLNTPLSASLSTCLHSAAWFRQADLAHWLIAFGADPNVKNLRGNTPAHLVCEQLHKSNSVGVLATFMLAGADMYARNHTDDALRPIDVVPLEHKVQITQAMVKERSLGLPSYKNEKWRELWRNELIKEWQNDKCSIERSASGVPPKQ